MASFRFFWGLYKGDSPILCQMLFLRGYVTPVSPNPEKFLLQEISRGSPGWLSNFESLSLGLHQLPAHHRACRHLRALLSNTANCPKSN